MEDEDVLQAIGARIRERRKALGLTQEDLSSGADIDRSYIGGIERGKQNPTITMLCKVCRSLRCDIASLTSGLPVSAE